MSQKPLHIRIRCDLPDPQDFVIFVNPAEMTDNGELFNDLYPIAWQVVRFAGSSDTNANHPYDGEFSLTRTVGVATKVSGNIIKPGSTLDVEEKKNSFRVIKESNDTLRLTVLGEVPQTARIANTAGEDANVFFGDGNGLPFMYQTIRNGQAAAFNEDTEIGIVAVSGYKQSQEITSEIIGAWVKFKVRGARNQHKDQIFFQYNYDNTFEAVDGSTAPFTQGTIADPFFGPSQVKTIKGASQIAKTMEVEV